MSIEGTVEEEIGTVQMDRPHVFVLGAGASRAAFPNGEGGGRKLPLMLDFSEVLGIDNLLAGWGLDPSRNIEDTFTDLHSRGETRRLNALEEAVEAYFGQLMLPSEPTIYDHLVLSLRSKDLIATFNWDPLLIQAYRRNAGRVGSLPRLAFLHGNVAAGFCKQDQVLGAAGAICRYCGVPFQRSRLLYPIGDKDYASDPFIATQWRILDAYFRSAFMITVFGYGAPKTDAAAIGVMQRAWGLPSTRALEQTSFITIQSEDQVRETWRPFIHSHHFEVHADFFDSWLANHPRRSGEAYLAQYLDARFIPNNPIPRNAGFPDLWNWYGQFREAEAGD
jgi:hypothetical protein